MEDKLHTNGYIIIKNPLSNYQKNNALDCIKDVGNGKTMIDYNNFNFFVNNDFIPKINETLGWSSIYLKYRFSNSQNSKDAATFHGDVYNFSDENLLPIYTGLIYFDRAVMEIIPGSHIKNNLSTRELYNMRKLIHMEPGDMLVFHANMHHRGVFYESNRKNRRLLQVFEIFPNK
jgi:ectoine hydroxylase-related dioxygenase (phytanoyl-CoA dioxygenase family)